LVSGGIGFGAATIDGGLVGRTGVSVGGAVAFASAGLGGGGFAVAADGTRMGMTLGAGLAVAVVLATDCVAGGLFVGGETDFAVAIAVFVICGGAGLGAMMRASSGLAGGEEVPVGGRSSSTLASALDASITLFG
jgi:hypothetical protein